MGLFLQVGSGRGLTLMRPMLLVSHSTFNEVGMGTAVINGRIVLVGGYVEDKVSLVSDGVSCGGY